MPSLKFPLSLEISSLCSESAAGSIDIGRGQRVPIDQHLLPIGQYFELVSIPNLKIFQVSQYFEFVNM